MDPKKQKAQKKKQYQQQKLALKSQLDNPKILQHLQKRQIYSRKEIPEDKKVPLFMHLHQFESPTGIPGFALKHKEMFHPSIIKFCLKRSKDLSKESSTNVIGFLEAIKEFLISYEASDNKSKGIKTELEVRINQLIQFVSDCIGITIGIGNAIKELKKALSKFLVQEKLSPTIAKEKLIEFIDNFIEDKIRLPKEAIIRHVSTILSGRNTFLTFSISYKIIEIISRSKPKRVYFVSDKEISEDNIRDLERLCSEGVDCVLVGFNSASLYINKADIVLLNAWAIFSNGTVLGERGVSSVALLASEHGVPLIVCCEAFKFTERVQLDPIVFNEVDSPEDIIIRSKSENFLTELRKWREIKTLKLLNLRYDIIPASFVSQIASEYGSVPLCSLSVIMKDETF